MKHWYLLINIIILPHITYGQRGYFATDSTASINIKLIDGGDLMNSKFCRVKEGDKIIKYTPYKVKEYGFKNGQIYISKEIQISDSSAKVFLERLYNGKTTLYYYKNKGTKSYYIEKDSTLFTEIHRQDENDSNYNAQLLELTKDCPNVSEATKYVSYNKLSMTKFVERYNNCVLKPFPHFRYGININYILTKFIATSNSKEELNTFDFKYSGGFGFGFFIDKPILVSDFSLYIEFNYAKHKHSYYNKIENKDLDFITKISSFELPISIRYTYPHQKNRPFINLGGIISYHFINESNFYETTINENVVQINDVFDSPLIEESHFGYSFGCGIEYMLNSRNSVFFEIRKNNLFNISGSGMIQSSNLYFITGINF